MVSTWRRSRSTAPREVSKGLDDPCRDTRGGYNVKAFRAQIRAMHEAAAPSFLKDNPVRESFWCHKWERTVIYAASRVEDNRRRFYGYRLVAAISAVVVPSLVGLDLSGTGGEAIRWLTFALSLVAAIATTIITLYRFPDRWLIYLKLRNDLSSSGWGLLNSPSDPDAAWAAFYDATTSTITGFDAQYSDEVTTAAATSKAEGAMPGEAPEARHQG